MEEDVLVTFETMLLAKKCGFIIESNNYNSPFYVLKKTKYYREKELTEDSVDVTACDDHDVPKKNRLYTSTQSSLRRWLRKKGYDIVIMPKITPSNTTVYYNYKGKEKMSWDGCHQHYEQALEEALTELLNLI